MSAGTPIQDFEKVTTISNESLYLVEMGDGSGTKTVTQETLVKETGKALKIGNLEELETEDKTSIVAAINEAAQSGGGGASVDILDTPEEIEANTEQGKVAGAIAVKEMISEATNNLGGFKPIINEIGKITGYKTTVGGADTVFPFSNSYPETYDFTIKSAGVQNADSYTTAACETTIPGGIYKYAKVVGSPSSAKINDEELTVNELYTIPDTNDDLQLYLSIRYSRVSGSKNATLTLYQNMPTD